MRLEDAKPYELRPGVWVSPGLQANELSLRQKIDHLADKKIRMTHQLARECGYDEAEILAVLGADREPRHD